MKKGHPHPENVERNAEILRRRREGEYIWRIARDMGLTRNQVIGVCSHATLTLDDQPDACRARWADKRASA